MRRATEADREAINAFLGPRAATSMFLLSNLAAYGFDRCHRNAMRYWIAEADGQVTGLVALSEGGTLMPQLAGDQVAAAARAVDGEQVRMLIGPAGQVAPLREAIGLAAAPVSFAEDQPQFLLDLDALRLPEAPGRLVPLSAVPHETLIDWRAGYQIESFRAEPDAARAIAETEIAEWLARDSHRALIVDGDPVCMTGFNARLPDIVQVGGVWTPHALRRRGHASRAVALHLAEARRSGVLRATLFAASESAARLYRALGFAPIGQYALVQFARPERADA